ncbi:LysR family transcriptional regulator [Opitutus terrae]|uniref:Transcriptional regulator, LysR family n=1 Tax=Opitutus terrae (strain DSM 11246 / JCM 15787 / PB90-1) TaxID=452637 RepID=B1ZS73_OPITP|nr:LysR family transcriptional regulator [Opitutus terrae]ACB75672.1 transcriptional regulator, LysR family [Opitutus terrae PB90-1]
MQLATLRAFLVVLAEHSVTAASTRLHLSQSTLTRQIAALEHEIGTPLLERHARGVAPTPAGQALADAITGPLGSIESAILLARQFGRGDRTELRIGYLQSLARSYLNPALAALRQVHPGVKVRLINLCAAGQMRALRANEIDVALIGHEGRLLSREFYARRVQCVPVIAALPVGHPLAARATLRLADLRRELFIGKDDGESPGHNEWIAQMCRRAGFRPRFVQHAGSISEVLSLAVSENAVALLPEFAAEPAAPSIATVPVVDAGAHWDLLVLWQRGRAAAPVKAFVNALNAMPQRPILTARVA